MNVQINFKDGTMLTVSANHCVNYNNNDRCYILTRNELSANMLQNIIDNKAIGDGCYYNENAEVSDYYLEAWIGNVASVSCYIDERV